MKAPSIILVAAALASTLPFVAAADEEVGEKKTILSEMVRGEVLKEDGFAFLSGHLATSELGETLSGEGPFTFFAPSDAALIRGLGRERIPAILGGVGREKLPGIYAYHVVPGLIPLAKIGTLKETESLTGQSIEMSKREDGLFVNESKVVKGDIRCSNGIIHLVDNALIPRADIVDTAVDSLVFKKLTAALEAVDMVALLKGEEPFTVFAPTDEAFEKLPNGALEMLMKPENKDKLREILSYHVVAGRLSAEELEGRESVSALNEKAIKPSKKKEGLFLDESLRQTAGLTQRFGLVCTNGLIHYIDSVLMPDEAKRELDAWVVERDRFDGVNDVGRRNEVLSKEAAEIEGYLKKRGIPMSTEGIGDYLKQITGPNPDPSVAKSLVEQLGSGNFLERNAAERALLRSPELPSDLLKEASRSANLEVSVRAKRILEKGKSDQRITAEEAIRAIELVNLPGLAEEIIEVVIKFEREESVARAAKRAMSATVTSEDIPFLTSCMSPESTGLIRAIAIQAMRQLADSNLADRFVSWSLNGQFDEETRLESALALADLGDRRSPRLLVQLMLEAESAAVRGRSQWALKKLTGQRFNYYAYAKPEVRIKEIEPWQEWVVSEGGTAKLSYPLTSVRSDRNDDLTLVALSAQGKVVKYDGELNEVWSYDCRFPSKAEKLPNGNVLIVGSDRVFEVTPEKEIARTYSVLKPESAQLLENGNFLITCKTDGSGKTWKGSSAFEVDPEGDIVWELDSKVRYFTDAFRLKNGNTLVCEVNPPLVAEIDRVSGDRVWEVPVERRSSIDAIQPLETGNVLISLVSGEIIEVDRATKEVVWQLKIEGARDAFRLGNGNTLIFAKNRFFEVGRDGVEIVSKGHSSDFGSVRR